MTKRKLALVTIVGVVLLASCNSDDNPTVSSLAVFETANTTCTTNTPRDINSINFADNDETQVDVTNLTPGCTVPGG